MAVISCGVMPLAPSAMSARRPSHAAAAVASTASHRPRLTTGAGTPQSLGQGLGAVRSKQMHCRLQQVICTATAVMDAGMAGDDAAAVEPSGNGFFAVIRAVLFYSWTLLTAVPLFIFMMAIFPFVYLMDKYKRTAEHMMNNLWAKVSTSVFYNVEIEGKENLPGNDVPAVYVANHCSYLDIYTLFHLDRNFKFISKLSNFLIPLIGWSMFMTGHIPLVRNERKSQMEALKKCRDLIEKGCSLLFFPEGTRTDDGKMHEFKKGAFSVAAKMKVPVVPITMVGTYQLMKNGDEGKLYPGKVRVIVHPMIDGNTDADTMMQEAYKKIASALPPGGVA